MARRGRNRKAAERHPSGKLKQPLKSEREDESRFVARVSRLRRQVLEPMDEPKRGNPLGRAFLYGRLTEQEYQAGETWNGLVRRYASIMGITLAPRITMDLEAVKGRSVATRDLDKAGIRTKEDYNEAFAALKIADRKSTGSLRELNRVAVWNQDIEYLSGLKAALKVLIELWHLDSMSTGDRRSMTRYIRQGTRPTDRPDLREY